MAVQPPKFIEENGVRKLNPAFKTWQLQQGSNNNRTINVPPSQNQFTALPTISGFNDLSFLGQNTQFSEAVICNQQIIRDDDDSWKNAGFKNADQYMAQISSYFTKYEVPIGMFNKLMGLSDFNFIEFIIDDSGSMGLFSDYGNGNVTRWKEAHDRLLQMLEIMTLIPIPPTYVRFLNRSEIIEIIRLPNESQNCFFERITGLVTKSFATGPQGTTPAYERIYESLSRCENQSMIRYFFGDGQPNGKETAIKKIIDLITNRKNPKQNPFTFISCTNEDDAVEWMKECEEVAPYCAEYDDYKDEASEVLLDQGSALPYTYGMYLICQLVGVINPSDLDAMDESVPLPKFALDNLQGYQCSLAEYKYYFDKFLEAQRNKSVYTELDKYKKNSISNWERCYGDFFTSNNVNNIQIVNTFRATVASIKAH
jgi:hypothetical protein